jgi:hypothetical protein
LYVQLKIVKEVDTSVKQLQRTKEKTIKKEKARKNGGEVITKKTYQIITIDIFDIVVEKHRW